MRTEDEVETELGTRRHVWIAALSDRLPPCPNRAGARPAALVRRSRAGEMYVQAPDGKRLSGVRRGWFSSILKPPTMPDANAHGGGAWTRLCPVALTQAATVTRALWSCHVELLFFGTPGATGSPGLGSH